MENYFAMTMDEGRWMGFRPGAGPYGRRRFHLLVPELALRSRQDQVQTMQRRCPMCHLAPGPVCGASGGPPQPRGTTYYTAETPISTPTQARTARIRPGHRPQCLFGTCSWRKTERINWLFCHSHGGAIWHLTPSLSGVLEGFGPRPKARVEKIHRPTQGPPSSSCCGAPPGGWRLLIAANPCPRLLTGANPRPDQPPMFCMLLRSACPAAAW